MSLETSAIQPGVVLPPVVVIGEVDQPIADHVWIDNVAATAAVVGTSSPPVGAGSPRSA